MKLFGLILMMFAVTSCDQGVRQDAVTLDGLLRDGTIDHFECSGGWPPSMTNSYYREVVPRYFHFFDATNRVPASSKNFYTNSPGQIAFFSGTNLVVALRFGGEDVFVFRDYYFRLRTPTNMRKFFPPF